MSGPGPCIRLTPLGHPVLVEEDDAPALQPTMASRLRAAFDLGPGHGLLSLGTWDIGAALPPVLAWWRDFAARFVSVVCTLPETPDHGSGRVPAPSLGELQALAWSAPPMTGTEYLTAEVLQEQWAGLEVALGAERQAAGAGLQEFLSLRNPAWNLVGRVHLHLAENRRDGQAPFAFLATYTTRLSAQAKAQHVALGQALQEFAGKANHHRLLALLTPLKRAGEHCPWLKDLIASRRIFHPLPWSPSEALRFLQDVPHLEQAGVVVRMPATWGAQRPARAQVRAVVGAKEPSRMGQDALLDFSVDIALDGEPLTASEVKILLAGTAGLVLIRGRWVEVDGERLQETLDHFRRIERLAAEEGLGFHQAMRLLAGAGAGGAGPSEPAQKQNNWSEVIAGPWLADTLKGLREPQGLATLDPDPLLKGTLRPYQRSGLRWLHLLSRLRLGACLADDMGLGKTIQIIALLLVRKRQEGPAPSLLVVPASLLANWEQEMARFAPSLRVLVAHPSSQPAGARNTPAPGILASTDLVITSYGSLDRSTWMSDMSWRLAVLDEAQAIRNPGTRQSRAAKKLKAQSRIALTGTPIENRLGDLWSIFDFLNPGLLGGAKAFSQFSRRLADSPQGYGPLRNLVQPYILRRLKTDRTVIADLPEKNEVKAFCPLSRRQAALYQQAVGQLAKAVATKDGIGRRGLVLAYLMRFKQICNHPSQWLGDGSWTEADSGKFGRLRELAETIAARQQKALVFTQFQEMVGPLRSLLGSIFGQPGLELTGSTPVKGRAQLVRSFQEDERVPFFVLSLKAGGSGLNLTAASHVIHFDRWWNPAVEDQATDRAFRIGQTRNVMVHKFVCRGTVEEKVDEMIAAKRSLSKDLLDQGGELDITSLDDAGLLDLVRLDLTTASAEG